MSQLQCEITIEAPLEMVFSRVTDFAHLDRFVSGITHIEMLTDGPTAVGTRFRETRVLFGRQAIEEMEVTALEHNASFELVAESCGVRYLTRHTFEQKGNNQTVVRLLMTATPLSAVAKVMGFVMTPLMKGTMRKCLENDLADLRRVCELGEITPDARGAG